MATEKLGAILDGLDITLNLADGDLIASAVVIAKVIDRDGEVSLGVANSTGCSWIEQLGLVVAAENVLRASSPVLREDDD